MPEPTTAPRSAAGAHRAAGREHRGEPRPDPAPAPAPADRSTARLIADLPRLLVELVQDELAALKKELTARIARLGIGAGLLAAAAFVGFFALAVFVAAAVIALSLVVPGWAAALITVGGLLLIAGILAAVGVRTIKKKSQATSDGNDG